MSVSVFQPSQDTVLVTTDHSEVEVFAICDDCREAYLDPPYYTFPTEACVASDDGSLHEDCTGNCCPDCVSMSIPDDPQDPRSSPEVREQAKDMGF